VRRYVLRAALELEVVADHVEILLGQVGFKQRAFAGVVELDGDSVLLADDHAGVVGVNRLAVESAVHVGERSVERRQQQAGLLGDDDPGCRGVLDGEVDGF